MIRKENLEDMLKVIGYVRDAHKKIYEKRYAAFDCVIEVDFTGSGSIRYPEDKGMKITRKTTCNFSDPENFVVLECITRLMDKGYRPEHIELEREWTLGHEKKSGFADILVKDEDGKTLFIIECKTDGAEYKKEYNNTLADGGQIFSYWQQERSCKWLALYASNFDGKKVSYTTDSVDCSDDANILLAAKKDSSIRLYKYAHTVEELYSAWNETYEKRLCGDVIFREDSQAYNIGVKPRQKKDLVDFTPDDKIVNRFEEILRHNNVSDKENAFNRLIALFICKLVDESTKGEEDEVEFQYKQGTDTYETLQDRLQRLHRDGMEKFMREEIYYVPADYPEWLFSTYTGAKRKKAIEDLQNTIRILKFYSNNDFAFKDVHNEELFYQNGKILVEMVQLFEKYRIVYPSKHQFLGDLFEQLLNKGFKQNEGQFFTPMPITRFIWDSLPVERMIKSERGTVYPKVIDYACGAGHFLTEAIEAINHFVHSDGDNAWARDHIYGIEKDYRLARVAKISLFMNGAGEGNIIFGDGLENSPEKGIENGAFDILVANPPYSVKDFKQHLQLKNNSFSILDNISINGGEIETLFVERIGQLLKPQGIAAVILPSPILSTESASYTCAREQFLKNFYIRAIVSFGSKTFGATGQNTVVMFLEKFNEPPKQIDLASDSVSAIFDGDELADWRDKEILEAYTAQIEVDDENYGKFLKKSYSIDDMNNIEYFKMYVSAFASSSEAGRLTKTKTYQKLSPEEQERLYLQKFYEYAHAIEAEKILYFSLVFKQTTVIITAPSENKEQKEFLGYDWSTRKGNEGIQIIHRGGNMYDDSDRTATGTLADAIRKSYYGCIPKFSDAQQKYGISVATKDMIDFSRTSFNKTIRTHLEKNISIDSKYEIREIGEYINLNSTSINPNNYADDEFIYVDIDAVEKGTGRINYSKKILGKNAPSRARRIAHKHNIILSTVRPNLRGFAFLSDEPNDKTVFSTGFGIIEVKDHNVLNPYYLYVLLQNSEVVMEQMISKMGKGQYPSINETDIKSLKIPFPPISVQRQIIDECAKVDKEYETTRMFIETYRQKIEDLFAELDIANMGGYRLSLSDTDKFETSIGKRILNKQLVDDGSVPVYSANVIEPFGFIDELLITDFSVPSVLWGIDGDWMTNYMPENTEFYPTDHCGVLRCKTPEVNPRYMVHILDVEGKKMGFSRAYRASIDRVQGITFSVPERSVQDKTIEKIIEIEKQIREAEKKLDALNGKTAEIVKSYL